jgi:iron complex outermembrane receptor protein
MVGAVLLAAAAAGPPDLHGAQDPDRAGADPVRLDTLAVAVGSNLQLADLPRSVEVITADELAAMPVTSVEAALRWAGAVDLQTRSPAQSDLSIRGGTFEQVLVLVDGMRVSDPQTGHFDLDLTIPIELVERIEILRGGASAAHGADAFGGVVNIVTKTPEATRGQVRLEGGSFSTFGGAVSLETVSDGGVGFTAAVGRDGSDGHRDGTDYDIWRVQSRVTAPVASGTVTADGGWAARDFGAQGFYATFDSFEETRSAHGSVRWDGEIGAFSVTPRVAYRKHDDTFILFRDDPAVFTNVHDSRQTMADVTARTELAPGVGLAFGGEWARETVESNNLGDREETRYGVFGELGVERGAFDLIAGLRLDDRENFDSFVSPSVAVALDAGDRVRLRAAASRAFRTPTWTDRYYSDPANVGNPDLEVETGWTWEGGADFALDAFGAGANVGVTVFERTTENLIDFARPAGTGDEELWVARNVEEADFTGLELDLSGVRAGPLRLGFSGAWISLETTEDAAFQSKSSLRPLTRRLSVAADLPVASWIWVGTRVLDRDRSGQEAVTTLDLRFRADVAGATLFVDALNVTDGEFLDVSGIPEAGAAVRIGVRTRFGG